MKLPKYCELSCQLDGKIIVQKEFLHEAEFEEARHKPAVLRETIIPIDMLSSYMKVNKVYWCENINDKQVHITTSEGYK